MNRRQVVPVLLATSALALSLAWIGYAAGVADAASYYYSGEVWMWAGVLGLAPATLGVGAALFGSRRAAQAFGAWCCVALVVSFGAFMAFSGGAPRWAYDVIPVLTIWCGALGIVGARFLSQGSGSGASSRSVP